MTLSGKIIGACLLALTLLAALDECMAEEYTFVEISQGVKISDTPWGSSNWDGDYPTRFAFGAHWELNKHYYARAEVAHISNLFDNSDETWLDWANVTIGYKF